MKNIISQLIGSAAAKAHATGTLPSDAFPPVEIEVPKIETHGDFATNFAMLSAKIQKMAPRQIAQAVVDCLEDDQGLLDRVELAGPGFINFFVKTSAWPQLVQQVLEQDQHYGQSAIGKGQKVKYG